MKSSILSAALMALLTTYSAFAAVELAKVNGKIITDADLRSALTSVNETQRDKILKDPNSRRQALLNYIDMEVLYEKALLDKEDQKPDFLAAMAQFKRQVLANRLLEKNVGSKVTESDSKKYYENNKPRYSTDQVQVTHILTASEKEAKALLDQVKKTGADFEAIAEKNSKDPSAVNNRGNLGLLTRDRMVPEFAEAVFRAKENSIIGPIQTTYGYHIVKVGEKRIGKMLEYGEVELRVREDMRRELAGSYVRNLRKDAKIQVNEENLAK